MCPLILASEADENHYNSKDASIVFLMLVAPLERFAIKVCSLTSIAFKLLMRPGCRPFKASSSQRSPRRERSVSRRRYALRLIGRKPAAKARECHFDEISGINRSAHTTTQVVNAVIEIGRGRIGEDIAQGRIIGCGQCGVNIGPSRIDFLPATSRASRRGNRRAIAAFHPV
jgi:hypothetical protein